MKLEIYESEKQKEIKPVRLKLKQLSKDVCVVAVDEFGNEIKCGRLLLFTPTGKIYLCGLVNPSLGFELDAKSHIKVENL